ncbi:zinc finger domain-containing protein [Paenibacillus sp. NAIST15-1]
MHLFRKIRKTHFCKRCQKVPNE